MTTSLTFGSITMPCCRLGEENPLPPLVGGRELHEVHQAPEVPEEIIRNLGVGVPSGPLPYTVQDGYDRELREQPVKVAKLENDHLAATFLLEYGGRLWSLVDKQIDRELLYRNRCLQFGNLAIRNAWFAGGVEWNIGIIGHCPHTCSPMFTAVIGGPDGEPVLRLYEFDRVRGVLYQIDCLLPPGSDRLFVTVTIRNPQEFEVPMYWWSNIAVPQSAGTRVLVPAERAFQFGYRESIDVVPVPISNGTDLTYPTRAEWARDFFFDIPEERPKWVAAVDAEGTGLLQESTPMLRGRKLFVWGTGASGTNWQRMLSPLGGEYLEIQAGLAKTQLEYLRMPSGEVWSWTECYGGIRTDPRAVHSHDWQKAVAAIEVQLQREQLQRLHAQMLEMREKEPGEVIQQGSGWAYVENARRSLANEQPLPLAGLPVTESSVGTSERPWLDLLQRKALPLVPSHVTEASWREMLRQDGGAGALYQLGILEWIDGNIGEAEDCWSRSLALEEHPWAHRNLAVAAVRNGRNEQADRHYKDALNLDPRCYPLLVEYAAFLLKFDAVECSALVENATEPRLRLIHAFACLGLGDPVPARIFLEEGVLVPDLREGESTVDDLLRRYREATGHDPSPQDEIDFRMSPG